MPRKSTKSPKTTSRRTDIVVTPTAIVIPHSKKQQKEMQRCLQRSGQITITFKEVSATKLPTRGALSVVPVND
jgi:hypothetical protein